MTWGDELIVPSLCSVLPDGVVPIFLSSKSQEIMGCVPYEDVTEESPFKLLKKEDILADMYNRAAISDFSPMKEVFNVSPNTLVSAAVVGSLQCMGIEDGGLIPGRF